MICFAYLFGKNLMETPQDSATSRQNGEDVKKMMTNDEFGEIHEAWAELKTRFDEMDACNAEKASGKFGTDAAQTASAQ